MLLKRIVLVTLLCLAVPAFLRAADEEEKIETEVAVHVAPIKKATLRAYVAGYGSVEAQPAGPKTAAAGARISSPLAGALAETLCQEGQHVEKGVVLFRLDNRLATAQAAKAKQALAFAAQNLERQKALLKVEGTSRRALQEAEAQVASATAEVEAARTLLDLNEIKAPLSGTVTKVNVRNGEVVDLTTVMAELIDLGRLNVALTVPQDEAWALKQGQEAEITPATGAAFLTGVVENISPQVDPATGTVLVRTSVPANAPLRPGQFVRARIVSEIRADRLAVPIESVVKDPETGPYVAVVENGKALRKTVKTGLRDGGLIEIEGEGIKEGQVVVTLGAYGLPKETKVRVLDK
jgi:membrane fusion protein (multidrug efflux system)